MSGRIYGQRRTVSETCRRWLGVGMQSLPCSVKSQKHADECCNASSSILGGRCCKHCLRSILPLFCWRIKEAEPAPRAEIACCVESQSTRRMLGCVIIIILVVTIHIRLWVTIKCSAHTWGPISEASRLRISNLELIPRTEPKTR